MPAQSRRDTRIGGVLAESEASTRATQSNAMPHRGKCFAGACALGVWRSESLAPAFKTPDRASVRQRVFLPCVVRRPIKRGLE